MTKRVVASHDPCPWLPRGGRAEVVLSEHVPRPTSVVRLLITAADAVLVVPRQDGRGLDIPSSRADADVDSALHQLRLRLLGEAVPAARLIGFVRNTVETPTGDYPWPAPVAHFAVWHCRSELGKERRGDWLDRGIAAEHLGERHWWPLLAHLEDEP